MSKSATVNFKKMIMDFYTNYLYDHGVFQQQHFTTEAAFL